MAPWAVFDLGEVLSQSPTHLARIAALLDRTEPEASAAYWRHRPPYDEGEAGSTYWRAVGTDLNTPVDDDLCAELIAVDALGWTSLHPESEPLLHEVKAAGYRLAMLSNLPRELATRVREQPWSALFDELVFSCDLGVMKPNPAIYRLTTERLGETAECVFFDDRPENVAAAESAGWRAYVWAGHDDAWSCLTRSMSRP
jgi:putative hydrolase of the HAD superfamily